MLIQLIRDPVECILRQDSSRYRGISSSSADGQTQPTVPNSLRGAISLPTRLDLGQPALPLQRIRSGCRIRIAAQVLPEHVRDVFRAEFANQLTATTRAG